MSYSAEKASLESIESTLSTILSNSNKYLKNKGVSAASNMSGIATQINKIQSGKASNTGSVEGTGTVGGSLTITHGLGVTPSYIIIYKYSSPSYSDGNPIWFSFNGYAVEYYSSFSLKVGVSVSSNASTVTLSSSLGKFTGTYTWYAIA